MTIITDIVIAIILVLFGYIYTCNHFQNVKEISFNAKTLKWTRNKVFYWIGAILVVAMLVSLFEVYYQLPIIQQVKLISLILIMIPIAIIDFREQRIPNDLLLVALAIRILLYLVEFWISTTTAWATLKGDLLGASIIGMFFLLLLIVFKNSIGMGDVKLFAVIGLYQGLWGAINSVFFSLVVSFFVSIILLITKRKERHDTISFGPSIMLGTIIAIGLAGM